MQIEILKESIFDDFAELIDFSNAATPNDNVLNGFQVDFDVRVKNDRGDTEDFHVVFQSTERTNGLEAYNGYEMSTASQYGCDSDDSRALEVFTDYDENVFDELQDRATELAKAKLASLLAEAKKSSSYE